MYVHMCVCVFVCECVCVDIFHSLIKYDRTTHFHLVVCVSVWCSFMTPFPLSLRTGSRLHCTLWLSMSTTCQSKTHTCTHTHREHFPSPSTPPFSPPPLPPSIMNQFFPMLLKTPQLFAEEVRLLLQYVMQNNLYALELENIVPVIK